mmetsp:Transcript_24765/g.79769  ORF Transcript_24765/g.79769 Transcript_24765/m.79769 type:complete len:206 (+) Transcript_24765:481-1098(+)
MHACGTTQAAPWIGLHHAGKEEARHPPHYPPPPPLHFELLNTISLTRSWNQLKRITRHTALPSVGSASSGRRDTQADKHKRQAWVGKRGGLAGHAAGRAGGGVEAAVGQASHHDLIPPATRARAASPSWGQWKKTASAARRERGWGRHGGAGASPGSLRCRRAAGSLMKGGRTSWRSRGGWLATAASHSARTAVGGRLSWKAAGW